MRLGVAFAFGCSYFGNQEYFEPVYLSTVFGICNVFARCSTIAAPMVVEVVSEPILTITICTFIVAISSSFLMSKSEGDFDSSGNNRKITSVKESGVGSNKIHLTQEKNSSDDGILEAKKGVSSFKKEKTKVNKKTS